MPPVKNAAKKGAAKGQVAGQQDKKNLMLDDDKEWSHISAMTWMWSYESDKLFSDQFGLDDDFSQRIFFDR